MNWLARLIDSFRGEPMPDPIEPVRPRVTPDPQAVEALERRMRARDYSPEHPFYADQIQQRCRP